MSDRVKAAARRLGGTAHVVGYLPGLPNPTPQWEIALSVEQADRISEALATLRKIRDVQVRSSVSVAAANAQYTRIVQEWAEDALAVLDAPVSGRCDATEDTGKPALMPSKSEGSDGVSHV